MTGEGRKVMEGWEGSLGVDAGASRRRHKLRYKECFW
jgi:hypothetical protein